MITSGNLKEKNIVMCDKDNEVIYIKHEHHLWPRFMDNPHGYSFEGNVSRIWLCEKHHKELHELIRKIMRKYSNRPIYKTDYHLWNSISSNKKYECTKETVEFTLYWLKKGEENGDTK